ncbi:MAG: hypothetical protein ABI779_22295, partial [Acidobacteriota bacterium]
PEPATNQKPETRNQKPETGSGWLPVSGFWFLVSGATNQQRATSNQQPATREHQADRLQCVVRHQRPGWRRKEFSVLQRSSIDCEPSPHVVISCSTEGKTQRCTVTM